MKNRILRRRQFLGSTAKAALGAAAAPMLVRSGLFGANAPSTKLNIACIGLGGQMQGLMKEVLLFEQNIVALCDVDTHRIEASRRNLGEAAAKVREYKDYRELLEREKSADAVVIATPDHWHAAISAAAIRAGKHVYCEKPLTHTVGEARQLRELSKQSTVATQTGNQGSASSNFRRSMELIHAGVLGKVSEVHLWHPRHGWPSGEDRPAGADPVPAGLDWDFWLGPAPARPYKQGIYHPAQWRGWYDFGGGSLADFCCHGLSMPVRALELDYPTRIEISGTELGKESFPKTCTVRFSFPARGGRGPVSIHFYSGGVLPPAAATVGVAETFGKVPETGCLVIGDQGTISAGLWNNECFLKLKSEPEFRTESAHPAATAVAKTLPRAPRERHLLEWIEACKGGQKTFSPFEIGGHITEIGNAGLLALRLGRDLDWDGAAMKASAAPEVEALVKPQHRKEWGIS